MMTQQADQTLSFLQTGFWIFLVLAVLFFIVTVILFFVFDILNIWKLRTGLAQKKTVKQMNERSREIKAASQKFYGIGFTDEAKTRKDRRTLSRPPIAERSSEELEDTVILGQARPPSQTTGTSGTDDTVALSGKGKDLLEEQEETTVLEGKRAVILPTDDTVMLQKPSQQNNGEGFLDNGFVVVKETFLVSSEEDGMGQE